MLLLKKKIRIQLPVIPLDLYLFLMQSCKSVGKTFSFSFGESTPMYNIGGTKWFYYGKAHFLTHGHFLF